MSDNKWKTKELGFFDLYLTNSLSLENIITINKKLYYRSAILFIDKIADLVTVKPAVLIKTNINIYLRGVVLLWYILELNNAKRSNLRNNINDINL